MADPAFWGDKGGAQKVLQRRKRLENELALLKRLRGQEDDAKVLADWLQAGEDVAADFAAALDPLEASLEAAEFEKMLGGEHDRNNAILTINPGRAAPTARTGRRCCCACTCAGATGTRSSAT